MSTNSAGNGRYAHPWADALGELANHVQLHDSASFTPEGRRLLASMGVLEPDPLRVEAEEWLAGHTGCKTPATRHVRAALGVPWPDELLEAAERFKATPWHRSAA